MGSYDTVLISLLVILTSTLANAQTSPSDPRDQYDFARVTPSMAIIIVVLIAALFFMGFFSIYIRHCTNIAGGTVRPTGGATVGRSRRAAAARGLDASVIETFPTLVYSEVKGLKIGQSALECAVCLSEFEDDETLRLLPKCDHVFHPDCIDAWLASHTTCPVCRANLTPQPGEPETQPGEVHSETDLEAQNDVVGTDSEEEPQESGRNVDVVPPPQPEVLNITKTLNRNRTRGRPRRFSRSHSTGHSLVQPGENTDRYTLKLPVEVRKQIMTRELNRTMSMVVLSRERSSRRGYRVSGEGSSRGKNLGHKRLDRLDQQAKSDRWAFLGRASSFLTRASSSVRSPRVTGNDGESSSTPGNST